jgi:hypothetical protein
VIGCTVDDPEIVSVPDTGASPELEALALSESLLHAAATSTKLAAATPIHRRAFFIVRFLPIEDL